LIHGSIDKLLGRKGPSYQEYSDVWNLDDWWQANDVIQDVCKECGKHNLNKEQVPFITMGYLKAKLFMNRSFQN
jgi:hypothetical protein